MKDAPSAGQDLHRDTSTEHGLAERADDDPGRRSRSDALGALAVSGSNIARFSVQLALLPILARLIGPQQYGLVALAIPFILFCNVFSDGGLGVALARLQDVGREIESTVFWLAGGFALALALLFCLLAWPIAHVLHQPALPPLIMALSPIMVMSGLTAAANARIIRNGMFAVFAGGDLFSVVVSSLVAVAAALHGWGAWSVVAQQLTLWSCKLAWVQLGSRLRVGFVCKPALVVDLLRFGGHSMGAGLADFATRNVDNLIVGAVLGTLQLGYYAMAYQIIRVPDYVISGPIYLFVFSRIARGSDPRAPSNVAETAVASIRCAASALAAIFGGLAIVAPLAVPVLLGAEWAGVVGCMQWLSLAGFGFSMFYVFSAILMGAGRSDLQLRLSIAGSVLTIAGVAATARLGLEAVAMAVSAATLVMMALYAHLLASHLRVRTLSLLGVLVAPALSVAAMFAALRAGIWATSGATSGAAAVGRLVILVGIGAAVYGAVLMTIAGRRVRSDLRLLLTDAPRIAGAEA